MSIFIDSPDSHRLMTPGCRASTLETGGLFSTMFLCIDGSAMAQPFWNWLSNSPWSLSISGNIIVSAAGGGRKMSYMLCVFTFIAVDMITFVAVNMM
ncbi:hypothetical protein YC2023_024459 [Brassica napus]